MPNNINKHELKTWPIFYEAIVNGSKTFEIRRNDREFAVGHNLLLREWDAASECYTGRSSWYVVTYILHGPQFGIEPGYCAMSIKPSNP